MNTCGRCGVVMGNENVHLKFHVTTIRDVDPSDPTCPLDGAPVSFSSAGDNGGTTQWVCGHILVWTKEDFA